MLFWVAGSNNDINVLNQLPLFKDVLQGQAPIVNFMVKTTIWDTIFLMASTIPGRCSSRVFLFHKARNISY
jgi:hypothetical protein